MDLIVNIKNWTHLKIYEFNVNLKSREIKIGLNLSSASTQTIYYVLMKINWKTTHEEVFNRIMILKVNA